MLSNSVLQIPINQIVDQNINKLFKNKSEKHKTGFNCPTFV